MSVVIPLSAPGRPRSPGSFAWIVSMSPSASTEPSCSTVTLRAIRRHEIHVVLDHDDRVLAGEAERAARPCARSRSSVMPATGSSSSSSFGSCSSSMPISSHCFWPCESSPAGRRATSVEADRRERAVDRRRLLAGEPREERRPHALVGLHRELEVLEHAVVPEHRRPLELAADAGMRDLGLGQAREVDRLAEERTPRVGPRLAGDHVHHRRLAGAVRADDAAQLADVDRRARARSAP